jgi:hypothetical protein
MKGCRHVLFVPISDREGAMDAGAGLVLMDDGTMRIFLDVVGENDGRGSSNPMQARFLRTD